MARCWKSPYTPSVAEAPQIDGFPHAVCETDAMVHVIAPTSAEAGPESTLIESMLPARFRGPNSIGPCCASGTYASRICIRHRSSLCGTPLEELVNAVRGLMSKHHVGLSVTYRAADEPRCSAGDPKCLPVPYYESRHAEDLRWGMFSLPYDPELGRVRALLMVRGAPLSLGSGQCRHDGDCLAGGCGSGCVAWYTPRFGATCPLHSELFDAYCGCVEGQCDWFRSRRPQLVITPRITVTGWGNHGALGGAGSDAGSDEAAILEGLRGSWLTRQLQRCYLGSMNSLPQSLTIAMRVTPKGAVQDARVSGATPRAARCVKQVFGWFRFVEPSSASVVERRGRVARIRGTLELAKLEP